MAEFGVQLRKARENKGITQQTLAEQVFVTRQTVSRWETGERFPDIVTLKKLSQVLGVGVGELLSEDDGEYIVERSPVVEKNSVNILSTVLFSGIIISYLISVINVLIGISSLTESVKPVDVGILCCNAFGSLLAIAAFAAGFICTVKGSFSSKKVGAVIMAFYASEVIRLVMLIPNTQFSGKITAGIIAVSGIMGMISAYTFFWRKKSAMPWGYTVIAISSLGILRTVCSLAAFIVSAYKYVSVDTALNTVLNICIYLLFIYQVCELIRKRKQNSR